MKDDTITYRIGQGGRSSLKSSPSHIGSYDTWKSEYLYSITCKSFIKYWTNAYGSKSPIWRASQINIPLLNLLKSNNDVVKEKPDYRVASDFGQKAEDPVWAINL